MGYNRFRHLSEVSSKDAGDVMRSEVLKLPIKILSVLSKSIRTFCYSDERATANLRGCLENLLEFTHPLSRAAHAERSLNLGCVLLEIQTAKWTYV